jgi:hypothetical protein
LTFSGIYPGNPRLRDPGAARAKLRLSRGFPVGLAYNIIPHTFRPGSIDHLVVLVLVLALVIDSLDFGKSPVDAFVLVCFSE